MKNRPGTEMNSVLKWICTIYVVLTMKGDVGQRDTTSEAITNKSFLQLK